VLQNQYDPTPPHPTPSRVPNPIEFLPQERSDEVLDILGFSAYPDPAVPADLTLSTAEYCSDATFDRLHGSLRMCAEIVARYGCWEQGPFQGQFRKQVLAVEYATGFRHPEVRLGLRRGIGEMRRCWRWSIEPASAILR